MLYVSGIALEYTDKYKIMKYFTALWKLQCFCEIAEEPKDDYVKYYGNNRYDIMVITHFSIFNYWDYIKIFRFCFLTVVLLQFTHLQNRDKKYSSPPKIIVEFNDIIRS